MVDGIDDSSERVKHVASWAHLSACTCRSTGEQGFVHGLVRVTGSLLDTHRDAQCSVDDGGVDIREAPSMTMICMSNAASCLAVTNVSVGWRGVEMRALCALECYLVAYLHSVWCSFLVVRFLCSMPTNCDSSLVGSAACDHEPVNSYGSWPCRAQ